MARQPTTPSEFAVLLNKSLGTVSGHLAALQDAGAVEKVRTGRSVNYSLTKQGQALLEVLNPAR